MYFRLLENSCAWKFGDNSRSATSLTKRFYFAIGRGKEQKQDITVCNLNSKQILSLII